MFIVNFPFTNTTDDFRLTKKRTCLEVSGSGVAGLGGICSSNSYYPSTSRSERIQRPALKIDMNVFN